MLLEGHEKHQIIAKVMYLVIKIFILYIQNLIGQKIQKIACFQETQRFL